MDEDYLRAEETLPIASPMPRVNTGPADDPMGVVMSRSADKRASQYDPRTPPASLSAGCEAPHDGVDKGVESEPELIFGGGLDSPDNDMDVLTYYFILEARQEVAYINRLWHAHRTQIIEALAVVALQRLCFSSSTLHMATCYFDTIANKRDIQPNKFAIVSTVCLWMAAKLNEPPESTPRLSQLIRVTGLRDHRAALIRLEREIMILLDYRLNVVTPVSFVGIFCKYSLDEENDTSNTLPLAQTNVVQLRESVWKYCEFFVDLIWEDTRLAMMIPSCIAAAAIAASRFANQIEPVWSQRLVNLTKYTLDTGDGSDIRQVVTLMWRHYELIFRSPETVSRVTLE